jgi:hypothetical protein
MSPPRDGEGRPPGRMSGQDAENVTTEETVTDPAAQVLAVMAWLTTAAFRAGRLSGYHDGWTQGLAAGLERRAA